MIEKVAGDSPQISLRLWDGTVQPVTYYPDKYFEGPADRCTFHFHYSLPNRTSAEQLDAISIVFDFPRGRFEQREPAKQRYKTDEYLNTDAYFWEKVAAHPTSTVLEVGSRARSGVVRKNLVPTTCSYTGMDITAGENVDVVGDAHRMSEFLPHHHFDFVFSVAVWEHLAMPWRVSLELNRVMKLGGEAMIATHQSWPGHEEPWDFFRFSNFTWDALFNEDTGFEIVKRGTGVPCVMAPALHWSALRGSELEWHYGFLCTRCVARKIGEPKVSWPVDPASVTRGTYSH